MLYVLYMSCMYVYCFVWYGGCYIGLLEDMMLPLFP